MLFRRTFFIFLTLLALLSLVAACGGSDDDDADSGDDDDDSSAQRSSGGEGKYEVDVPKIKEVVYSGGKVHLEVSGDEDAKIDADGNGIATPGFLLATYGSADASVILSFLQEEGEGPGAIAVTTADFGTGGEWGKECSVSMEETSSGLKGEFECKSVDAVAPKSTKEITLKLKGDFTVTR